MLYFLFTVDGDWKEYFDVTLPDEKRMPQRKVMEDIIWQEVRMARKVLAGKFIHFIHTSPRMRDFFFEGCFVNLYKTIIAYGGDVGLHCHEDEPYKGYYFSDLPHMRRIISWKIAQLRRYGIKVCAYRGGFMAFTKKLIPILEENGLRFDFSCEPGRCLVHNKTVVSDWRGAPEFHYKMSYDDHCKSGNSKVWEIPVGTSQGKYLYFEKSDLKDIKKIGLDLKTRSVENRRDIVVSVLSHTYEFESLGAVKVVEGKLTLLKKYGTFINLKELGKILS